jgi:hypothetical protein
MTDAKLVVIYPHPKGFEAFEKADASEHLPLVVDRLGAKPEIVSKNPRLSERICPLYRITEVYFPSIQVLEYFPTSSGGIETTDHAAKISTGGGPLFLIAQEESFGSAHTAGPHAKRSALCIAVSRYGIFW